MNTIQALKDDFIKRELRKRFDSAKNFDVFIPMADVLLFASFEPDVFGELLKEMESDLKSESEDLFRTWRMKKNADKEESRQLSREPLYETQEVNSLV